MHKDQFSLHSLTTSVEILNCCCLIKPLILESYMVNIIKGRDVLSIVKKIPIIVHTNLIIVEAKQFLKSKDTDQREMLSSAISLPILLIKTKSKEKFKKHLPPGPWGLPLSEASTTCSPHSRKSCLDRLTWWSCPLQRRLRRCSTPRT
jgi:hypothetical protein